ncbi:MAG TPA: M23 family metallopeptidase [Pyrinomonadaceae bacterium]|nr:M23 family metallopeptidase [Pyrinomonadaceae bacterium]
MISSPRFRVLVVILLLVSATVIAARVLHKRYGYDASVSQPMPPANRQNEPLSSASPAGSVESSPEITANVDTEEVGFGPSPTPQTLREVLTLEPSYVGRLNLAVPVKGVKPEQLMDTFKDARSEGRVHDAIDIPAPAGTPVIATAEGDITKLFQSERGGITIYQASVDKKLIFYYAHLQGYAEGLTVGKRVWQGETIGYVGDTGNAGAGNYHLHFSIMITKDPKRYWEGTNINPYPLLRRDR